MVVGRSRRCWVGAAGLRSPPPSSKRPGVSRHADLDAGGSAWTIGASTIHASSVVRRRWEHVRRLARVESDAARCHLSSRALNG